MLPEFEHDNTTQPEQPATQSADQNGNDQRVAADDAGVDAPAPESVTAPSDGPDATDQAEEPSLLDHVPARFAAIADDVLHEVDPKYVPAERVGWWIFLGIVSLPSFVVIMLAWPFGWFGQLGLWITSASWTVVTLVILFFTLRWPQLTYKYTRYRVDVVGIEIRKGVLWRGIHNVPRNRVQHTDVRQGPLERRFGIATLTVFTAGTSNASVELSGLTHERALMIRDYLIARDDDEERDDDGV